MRRVLLAIVLTIGLAAPVWADFQAGLDAYQRGDYPVALEEWQPLAEAGSARAQFNLGILHAKGQGVPKDLGKAMKWYRKAAERGYARAQVVIGLYYEKGKGVPKDLVEAFRWYRKAALQGDETAKKRVSTIERDHPEIIRQLRDEEKQRLTKKREKQARLDKERRKTEGRRKAEQQIQEVRERRLRRRAKQRLGKGQETQKKELQKRANERARQTLRQESGDTPAERKRDQEWLSIPIPQGWELSATEQLSKAEIGDSKDRLKMTAEKKLFLPPGESPEDWSQVIVTEQFRRLVFLAPYRIYMGPMGSVRRNCDFGYGPEPKVRRIHGHLTVQGFYACTNHKADNRGLFVMLKVIEGRKNVYLIRREWRGEPFSEDEIQNTVAKFEDWIAWFDRVRTVASQKGATKKTTGR